MELKLIWVLLMLHIKHNHQNRLYNHLLLVLLMMLALLLDQLLLAFDLDLQYKIIRRILSIMQWMEQLLIYLQHQQAS